MQVECSQWSFATCQRICPEGLLFTVHCYTGWVLSWYTLLFGGNSLREAVVQHRMYSDTGLTWPDSNCSLHGHSLPCCSLFIAFTVWFRYRPSPKALTRLWRQQPKEVNYISSSCLWFHFVYKWTWMSSMIQVGLIVDSGQAVHDYLNSSTWKTDSCFCKFSLMGQLICRVTTSPIFCCLLPPRGSSGLTRSAGGRGFPLKLHWSRIELIGNN